MDTFNDKMYAWFSTQNSFFKNNDVQEDLLCYPELLATGDAPLEEVVQLMGHLCKEYLKLSFILAKHQKEFNKLMDFLE